MKNNKFTIKTIKDYITAINCDGNIYKEEILKKVVCDENDEALTNLYDYIEQIDDDVFIFGILDFNKSDYYTNRSKPNFTEVKISYGIFKLTNNKKEDIIVPAIYDRIDKNNDKTLLVYIDKYMTYFDYEKRCQIIPAKLTKAADFDNPYHGFVKCEIDNAICGYLPRNTIPKEDINSIILLTEDEVNALIEYENKIDLIKLADKKYFDLTDESYIKSKK